MDRPRILPKMSHRFYVNQPLAPGPLTLHGPEAHHLATVSRFRVGDAVCLFNGDGFEYPATILKLGKKSVELEVADPREHSLELSIRLTVACPLPKGDRGQFLIEKLTELGVTSYIPLITERTVFAVGDARAEKLRRYVQEACKQCGRNRLMQIEPPLEWSTLIALSEAYPRRWLGQPGGSRPVVPSSLADALVAVGPEGGLTREEVAFALQKGWSAIDLGPRILRVETAALVLAALASLSLA